MVPVSGGLDMLELCQAGKLESMALRDGGMIIEACDVTNSNSCVICKRRIKTNYSLNFKLPVDLSKIEHSSPKNR